MGFDRKWISWIDWCISTISFSVLFNDSPTGFLRSTRGLRQWGPLSPNLFVIGIESLSCLLKRAVEGNFISGCKFVGRGGELVISHLLYTDDIVLFCDANSEQLMYLGWTLMLFEAILGLIINPSKSEIILVGRVDIVELLVVELGCGVDPSPPCTWVFPLGLLIGRWGFEILVKKDLERD